MENHEKWNNFEKFGKVQRVAHGADSTVYSIATEGADSPEFIAKLYDKDGFSFVEDENKRKTLEEYYRDTIKAQIILKDNPNPLNQTLTIDDEIYTFEYSIVPQGSIIFEEKSKHALFGQEFVAGLNLGDLYLPTRAKMPPVDKNQTIFLNNLSFDSEVYEEIVNIFYYLSDQINRDFEPSMANVKPYLDKQNKKIIIKITDLAASLSYSYRRNKAE